MSEKYKAKILLIEDESDVRESYEDMFNSLGFSVESAENGMDGLKKLAKSDFDLVVTDLHMPVMDGMETLRRIKKQNKDVEVIVITGFATIENAIKAMKQGAFDYITKPVSLEHVRIVLNKCAQQIKDRRENQELKEINSRLQELNDLKNKFITITNHELRTPMAVLKGYMELLGMEVEDHEELKEYYNVIMGTLSEMMDMVENMHDLSGFQKFASQNHKEVLDINELLNEVSKEIKIIFKNRNIRFKIDFYEEKALVKANRSLLKQGIRELVQNAFKFTKDGGSVTVCVKLDKVKGQVFVVVADSGIGIPNDKLKLIFEPFYEVQDVMHHFSSKTDFMGGGIGVGLSLAKEIIESASGEIVVESTPQEGSTFTVILPMQNVA